MLDEQPVGPSERDVAAPADSPEPSRGGAAEAAPSTPRAADELRELVLVRDGIKYARLAAPPVSAPLRAMCTVVRSNVQCLQGS